MPWAIHEGDVSDQQEGGLAAGSGALGGVFLARAEGLEALWSWAGGALVELGIGIAQLNCDVTEALFVVAHSLK